MFGIWETIKAACFRSATIALSYVLVVGGLLLDWTDSIAALLANPDATQSVTALLGADPKVIAVYAKVTGIIVAVSRLRGIISAAMAAKKP